MNRLKTKIGAGFLSLIMMLTMLPFSGQMAMAAEMPQDALTVTTVQTQVYYDGGLVSGGNHFVMSDGSIAVCANRDIEAPQSGTSLTLSRTLGTSYIDGSLGEISTEWAFKCFYYSEKLVSSQTGTSNRSYATSLAIRQFFETHTPGVDDPYTSTVYGWYNEIVNAARADADGIGAQIQYIDGTAIYDRHDGTAARLALYTPNNAAQPLLVYASNIPYITTGYVNLVKSSANPAITDGNSCYSLAGAVYGVYTNWDCTNLVGTLTTDEWGNSNTIELNAGIYYVKGATRFPIST